MNNPLQTEQDSTGPALTWQLVHAVPGALVYAASSPKLPNRPLLRHSSGDAVEWVPSGEPEGVSEARHHGIDHPVLHYAGYIGRVGLLAAALGAGAAFAARPGIAAADPDSSSSASSSSDSKDGGSAHGGTTAHGPRGNSLHAPGATPRGAQAGQANSTPRADTRDAAGSGPSSSPSRNTSDKPADSPSRAARTAAQPAAHANSTDAPTGAPSSSTGRSTVDKPAAASTPTRSTPDTPAPARSTQDTPAATSAPTSRVPAARAAAPESAVTNATTSRPDAVTYDVSGGPSDGTVTLSPQTGAFDYTPRHAPGPLAGDACALRDSFSVTINDGQGDKATLPVAVFAGEKTTEPTTKLVVSGSATSGDLHVSVSSGPVTYLVVHDPALATVTQSSVGYAYTPAAQTAARITSLAAVTPSVQATAVTTTVVPNVIIEAESMAVTPTKAGRSYSDSTASGTRALVLSSNGTASTTLTLPDATSLVIRAKGDQYKGAPSMTVSIDGKAVSTIAVSSTTWTDYTVPIATSAGTHTVSIAFTNDLYASKAKDRNLRIDKVTLVAAAVPTQTPAYFPAADWLNKPIAANAATAANSATWVGYLSAPGQQHIADLYNYGVTIVPASAVTASTPRYDVAMSQPWGADPFGSNTVPIPKGTVPPPGFDGQIAVVDTASGQVFGIWQAKYNSSTNTWSGSWGGMTPINGNGIDTSGSATAAGISRLAGVVTAAELSAAIANNTGVNHALVFSSDIAGPGFVGPAIKSDGTNIAGVAIPMPEGYRIQLDPSINVDALPGLTPGEKVIAKTLQTYGAYIVDRGSARMAFAFETLPGATSSNPGAAYTSAGFSWDYYDMAHIPWSSLRVLAP